jgi:two-component system, NtrC family, nitrogen regulation sensor histidine kinase NtrY
MQFKRSSAQLIELPGLLFIYALLIILGIIFSSYFFQDLLRSGTPSIHFALISFLAIFVVVLFFTVALAWQLLRDVVLKRPGSRFRWRLLFNFTAVLVLSSIPPALISVFFVGEVLETWYSDDIDAVVQDARWFALDSYRYRLKTLELLAKNEVLEPLVSELESTDSADARERLTLVDAGLLAVQEILVLEGGLRQPGRFIGSDYLYAQSVPWEQSGFLPADPIQKPNVLQYLSSVHADKMWLLSMDLGAGIDQRMTRIDNAVDRTFAIRVFKDRTLLYLVLVYGVFAAPSILMALIIAFSLSGRLTRPLVSLDEATKKVASGDFSVRVFAHPGDELGTLVQSFNTMVQDLDQSRSTSLRAEKFNMWQDMAQRLAHEIKNPLTPVRLSAERLLRRWRNSPEELGDIFEEAVAAIIKEVDSLSALLAEFRSYSRLPSPNKAPEDVTSFLAEALSIYKSSYPDISFSVSVPDDIPPLPMDKRLMSQVFSNLCTNAVDAMNANGRLDVVVELVIKRDTRYCRFIIRDSGCGIDQSHHTDVFTPYFTTKMQGSGLGLSIVERIVSDHGGSIWFDSAIGEGTSFYIDVPLYKVTE